MKTNTLHYNYSATVREIYDLTKEEALILILKEQKLAQLKKHAVIVTNKKEENESAFSAKASKKLSRNFTWIHFCPQEILNFDDDTPQEEKYYVMIFESVEIK